MYGLRIGTPTTNKKKRGRGIGLHARAFFHWMKRNPTLFWSPEVPNALGFAFGSTQPTKNYRAGDCLPSPYIDSILGL